MKMNRFFSALALLALLAAMTAHPAFAAGTGGWKRAGSGGWYYYKEDGSLLRGADTPDGFHTDENGCYAGKALGSGPFPVLLAEKEEEARLQAAEEARLYAIAHPDPAPESSGQKASGPAGSAEEKPAPMPAYTSIFSRPAFRELRKALPRTSLSGQQIGGMPAEFFMLSVAGETSGSPNLIDAIIGDSGKAYGPCQYDYRYDLVDFMNFAYRKHPALWSGFLPYLDKKSGDMVLVQNAGMKQAFRTALLEDTETCLSDQLEYMRMLYWDGLAAKMNAAGFRLDERSIAVSAALFSVSVNCGPQPEVFIRHLSPSASDAELLDGIYRLRNTVFADQPLENRLKETNERYLIYEPEMAADLMFGNIHINTEKIYGSGVEWYGNPF